jgi:hypothetical protein
MLCLIICEEEQSASEALISDYLAIHSTVVALHSSLRRAGLPGEIAIRSRPVSEPPKEKREMYHLVSPR